MKTPLSLAALTIAAGLLVSSLSYVRAADQNGARGGAADLVANSSRAKAVQKVSGHCDKAAPACAACETVRTTQTITEGKMNASRTIAVEKHLCGSCATQVATAGHGKTRTQTVSHTCKLAQNPAKNCCVR